MKKRGHKKNRKVVGLEKLVFHPTSYNCKQSSILVECIHNEKNNTFTKFPKEFESVKIFQNQHKETKNPYMNPLLNVYFEFIL